MRISCFIAFSLLLFFSGCTQKALSPKEYMNWVSSEENGLHVIKKIGNCTFALQYKPGEYEVLLHRKDENISQEQLRKATEPLKELQYFSMVIKTEDGKEIMEEESGSEQEYAGKLNYMTDEMQQDFTLIDGNDTLPCAFYHYERSFGLSPDNTLLLGFEIPVTKQASAADKTVIYNDKLLGNGQVRLTIKAEDLTRIPRLKFQH